MIGRQIQQATPRPGSGLTAGLFLLHAPSVYDFRERDDMLFAYLRDSDSANVSSVYEMYPIGWFSIRQRLADCGFDAKIVNVASLMRMYPDLDVRRLQATGFAHKPTARHNNAHNDLIVGELHTMREAAENTSIYALQCYSENMLRKMGESTDAYIMLSLESHDPKISTAAGRDTVSHPERLIRKFSEWKALPLICPMVPFLERVLVAGGGRWFDDATVPQQMIEDCLTSRPGPASLAAA